MLETPVHHVSHEMVDACEAHPAVKKMVGAVAAPRVQLPGRRASFENICETAYFATV
jgi:hypothetical protein